MKKMALIILLSCVFFVSNSSLAYSADYITLKLTGIDGESMIQDHEDEIDILAWSWAISNDSQNNDGGGDSAGKAIVSPLIVTKYIDKASPLLALKVLTGEIIEEAILFVIKAGETPFEYLKITMTNVGIVNFSNGGSSGEDRLTESVTIVFSKVCYEYTPQKEDGTPDATIQICWDIVADVPF
jgi:type VI secretion system secreted protein Hcp